MDKERTTQEKALDLAAERASMAAGVGTYVIQALQDMQKLGALGGVIELPMKCSVMSTDGIANHQGYALIFSGQEMLEKVSELLGELE